MREPQSIQPDVNVESREPVWFPAIVLAIGMGVIGAALVGMMWGSSGFRFRFESTIVFSVAGVAAFGCILGYAVFDQDWRWWVIPTASVVFGLSGFQSAVLLSDSRSEDRLYVILAVAAAGQFLLLIPGFRRAVFVVGIVTTIFFGVLALIVGLVFVLFVWPAGVVFAAAFFGMWVLLPLAIAFVLGALLRTTLTGESPAQRVSRVQRLLPRQFGLRSIFATTTVVAIMAAVLGQVRPDPLILLSAAVAVDIGVVIGIVAVDVMAVGVLAVGVLAEVTKDAAANREAIVAGAAEATLTDPKV